MADKETIKVTTQNFGNEDAKQIATYEKLGGYASLKKAVRMKHAEVIEEVKKANLRGRGGAGFPAGVKWGFVPKDAETVYLVVNADEGEPGTFKDRTLIELGSRTGWWRAPPSLAYAIRAHHVFIYIRGELVKEAQILEQAIEEAYERGYLGKSMAGSGWAMDMVVHRGAGAYICGEETSLLNSLEGRSGLAPAQAALPRGQGAVRPAHHRQQRGDADERPHDPGKGRRLVRRPGGRGGRRNALRGDQRPREDARRLRGPGGDQPQGADLRGRRRHARRPALKGVIPGGSSTPVLTADEIDVPYASGPMGSDEKIGIVEVRPGQPFDAGFPRAPRCAPCRAPAPSW